MGFIGIGIIIAGIVAFVLTRKSDSAMAWGVGSAAAAVLGVLIILCAGIRIISPTDVGVPVRLGANGAEMQKGLHLVDPFFTNVVTIDKTVHSLSQSHTIYTSDGQTVTLTTETQYALGPKEGAATFIYLHYGGELENAERKLGAQIAQAVREVGSQYTGMELITKRTTLGAAIAEKTTGLGSDMHLEVEKVVTTNLDFTNEFESAISATMTAQQEKKTQAEVNAKRLEQAETDRQIAEKEAAAQVARAEGEAQAMEKINAAMEAAGGSDAYLRNKQLDNERARIDNEVTLGKQYLEVMDHKWNGSYPSSYAGLGGSDNPLGMGGLLFNIGGTR